MWRAHFIKDFRVEIDTTVELSITCSVAATQEAGSWINHNQIPLFPPWKLMPEVENF